ncbi:MAG: hypothetical protein AABW47_00700 [Nanoarchaeota archaeon]|mgnify:CR=1 FL=1
MSNITIRELNAFFRKAKEGDTIPFKNTEMVEAVRCASLDGNFIEVLELSETLENAYTTANPNKPKARMIQNARETLTGLAYLADYECSPLEWMEIGPAKAYALKIGKDAMNLVQKVYENRQIDIIRDIFPETTKEIHGLN